MDMPTSEQAKKRIDIRVIIPNIITLIALASGVTAIKFAVDGRFEYAAAAILISAFLDGLDGQIARLLRGTSSFGAELDSLADLVNFGVSPALVMYLWGLHEVKNFGWLACLIFIIAMALRLARFNVLNNLSHNAPENEAPATPKSYFLGIPAPASALLCLFPLYIDLTGFAGSDTFIYYISVLYILVLSAFTVSSIKTFSPKSLRFQTGNARLLMIGIAIYFACLITLTWHTLMGACLVYCVHLFYATLRFLKKR